MVVKVAVIFGSSLDSCKVLFIPPPVSPNLEDLGFCGGLFPQQGFYRFCGPWILGQEDPEYGAVQKVVALGV